MSTPSSSDDDAPARDALAHYEGLAEAASSPLPGGHLHSTYAVTAHGAEYILQRVSPVFSTRIHENIDAVTRHLARKGVPSVELVPTREGELFVELGDAGRWRLQQRLPGYSLERCRDTEQARAAGALVARFHSALADFDGALHPLGFTFHDTAGHLADLERVVEAESEHRLHAEIAEIASEVKSAAAAWRSLGPLPERVIHGDLKFANLLIEDGRPTALIDLDTLARMPLWIELGDAWRSWCNPASEDIEEADVDLALFRASAEGYLEALDFALAPGELESLVDGLERIALELCARFASDALKESYFGWDEARFSAAGEHNLARARGQLSLHRRALETREQRRRILLG
jgi:Ser/Thr protein kinase RdoA (MazF antagonist)